MPVPGIPTSILVAPDSFKGTLSAAEVSRAIATGLDSAGVPVDLCPVADGGEGTLDALVGPLGGQRRSARVLDPLGREIEATYAVTEPPAVRRRGARAAPVTGILEVAAASGLGLLAEHERDPIAASSYGAGQLILAAAGDGAEMIYVGVGGSATMDGGAGAIRAIREGGGLGRARVVVLCDVRTPFEDAPRIFGPQKGASEQDVRKLTSRMHRLARGFARDPRGVPMTGAAGGFSGGLWAEFDAELAHGAAFILDMIDFDRRMRAARAVVAGEGQLDEQSLAGKAVSEVATRARQSGVPCFAVVGRRKLDAFGARMLDLQAVLEAGTPAALERAGRELATLVHPA